MAYSPTNWQTGDLITADAMNKLEQGIVSAETTAATQQNLGMVKQGAFVANAAGDTPTQAEFNALLASLTAAGILASS